MHAADPSFPSVLVAIADPALLGAIGFVLDHAGYTVISAPDAPTAVQQWQATAPALMLLDADLPDNAGWDLYRLLRLTQTTRVVLLGKGRTIPHALQALPAGADGYLTQPVDLRELLHQLEAASTVPHQDRRVTGVAGR